MPDRPSSEQLDQVIDGILSSAPPSSSDQAMFSGMSDIAVRLRDLPDYGFKTHLIQELLQRATPMSPSTRESIQAQFATIHSVTPFICVPDGSKFIEFMKHTFAAEETHRHPHGPDGFVANVRIGDSDLLVMSGESLRGAECPAALHVYVPNCDATYSRAIAAGAGVISAGAGEPADRPYGERAAFVSDPFGNNWFIATRFGSDYVGPGLGYVTPVLLHSSSHAQPLVEFLQRAFGARVDDLHAADGRIVHAFVRLGAAVMEIGEALEEQMRPFSFYIHTNDVDAVYDRAIDAGGLPILPPADQGYGDRLAIVQDPAGNRWFAAKRVVTT